MSNTDSFLLTPHTPEFGTGIMFYTECSKNWLNCHNSYNKFDYKKGKVIPLLFDFHFRFCTLKFSVSANIHIISTTNTAVAEEQ
jgi:hypothetical protein